MHLRRMVLLALVTSAAMLVGAGCGDSDTAGEKIAEEVIENSGGEDVDVDVDGDDVTIESKDGDASFSTSGDLPDGWPKDIELPDGAKVVGSTGVDTDQGRQLTVNGTADDSPEDVFEHFAGQLDGWEQNAKSVMGTGDDKFVNAGWTRGDETATLTTTSAKDAGETTFVFGITTVEG